MLESIKKIDEQLLLFGNSLHNSFFDAVVPYLTDFWIWIPLFLWWAFELYKIYKRKLLIIIFCVIGLLIIADRSSVLIKDSVQRYRPTHNIELKEKIHVVNDYRGGQYGYISSHATNAFAIAIFIFLLVKPYPKKWLKLTLFVWAMVFCFTRIYLGVHYPFDLFSGALLGTLLAFVFYKIFSRFIT
ncbi:MAG TPA: phosphatase PAP2 family protein [Bacteroidia bacterium]|nr:phosphatase PAP2 family protein [Bacteroidia bacterium]